MAAYCSWLMYYAPSELVLPSIRMMYRERWNLAYNEIRRGLLDKRPRELYRQRLATSHVDYTRCLKSFKRPALCIVGDFSEFGVNCMKDMVSQLPHAQLAIIPNALDPSNLCQPEKFNAILQRFWRNIRMLSRSVNPSRESTLDCKNLFRVLMIG